jgi:hypothetical protein
VTAVFSLPSGTALLVALLARASPQQVKSTLFYSKGTPMNTNSPAGKAERIILALLEHGTHEKAAAALGISPVTVWRWLQKPKFQEQYRQARCEAFSRCKARLQHAANTAVSTLLRIMLDKEAPAGSRVHACDSVLKHGDSFEIEDLQVRMGSIEQIQNERSRDSREQTKYAPLGKDEGTRYRSSKLPKLDSE